MAEVCIPDVLLFILLIALWFETTLIIGLVVTDRMPIGRRIAQIINHIGLGIIITMIIIGIGIIFGIYALNTMQSGIKTMVTSQGDKDIFSLGVSEAAFGLGFYGIAIGLVLFGIADLNLRYHMRSLENIIRENR